MMLSAKPLELPIDGRQSETALAVARGTARLLHAHGFSVVSELPLPSGRRADLVALDAGGEVWIVEIKSSVADFRADQKWQDYRLHCDRLFFATAIEVPLRSGNVYAEGDLDFRGTLGIDKEVPVGFAEIRLRFEVDTDAP